MQFTTHIAYLTRPILRCFYLIPHLNLPPAGQEEQPTRQEQTRLHPSPFRLHSTRHWGFLTCGQAEGHAAGLPDQRHTGFLGEGHHPSVSFHARSFSQARQAGRTFPALPFTHAAFGGIIWRQAGRQAGDLPTGLSPRLPSFLPHHHTPLPASPAHRLVPPHEPGQEQTGRCVLPHQTSIICFSLDVPVHASCFLCDTYHFGRRTFGWANRPPHACLFADLSFKYMWPCRLLTLKNTTHPQLHCDCMVEAACREAWREKLTRVPLNIPHLACPGWQAGALSGKREAVDISLSVFSPW